MQIELRKIQAGIPHQMNIADDVLIGGTVEEQDKALVEVLATFGRNGITLNPKKCIFDVTEVTFMGLVFSASGIKPDPKHIKNLTEAIPP